MEKAKEIIEVLNDLVMINNDRIKGYEEAAKELKDDDQDLRSLFDHLIVESQQIKSDLIQEIQVLHGDVENKTTEMGKIYRGWAGLKAIFTGDSRHAILSNCEFGEDAAQKDYKEALQSDSGLKLSADIREMITRQKEKLRASHDRIKLLRDAQPA